MNPDTVIRAAQWHTDHKFQQLRYAENIYFSRYVSTDHAIAYDLLKHAARRGVKEAHIKLYCLHKATRTYTGAILEYEALKSLRLAGIQIEDELWQHLEKTLTAQSKDNASQSAIEKSPIKKSAAVSKLDPKIQEMILRKRQRDFDPRERIDYPNLPVWNDFQSPLGQCGF